MTNDNVRFLFGPVAEVVPELEPDPFPDLDTDLILDLLTARESCHELRPSVDRYAAALLDVLGAQIALTLDYLGFGIGEEADE